MDINVFLWFWVEATINALQCIGLTYHGQSIFCAKGEHHLHLWLYTFVNIGSCLKKDM